MNPAQVSRISLAKDFSPYPSGRYRKDGKYSAEQFRSEHLLPLLRQAEENTAEDTTWVVEVSLDEVAGVSASFLEEAFGGLVRAGRRKEFLDKHLLISTSEEDIQDFVLLAKKYINDAKYINELGHEK